MTRHLLLLAVAIFAAPAAHAGGYLAAEVARYDAETTVFGADLDADGTLYGGSAQLRTDGTILLALEGRGLIGNVDYELAGGISSDPLLVTEGRALLGADLGGGVYLYTGGGLRNVTTEAAGVNRVSSNLYLPLGLTAYEPDIGGGWGARTQIEVGTVLWGQEQIDGDFFGVSVDESVARHGGMEARFSIEFTYGPWAVAPYYRMYQLDETDSTQIGGGSYYVEEVEESETGVRAGLAF